MKAKQIFAIRRWPRRMIGAVVIGMIFTLVVIAAGALTLLANSHKANQPDQILTQFYNQGDPATPAPAAQVAAVATPAPTVTPQDTQRINVLLMGLDQRPAENAAYAKTDTMIIMTIDPISKTAGMLSIPRDLYVPLDGHGSDRINTAMALGGPQYAMRQVSTVFGLPIQHYVRVNFFAVEKLVDLVGGIDVYVDQDINDQAYPDMNYHYDPFVISKGMHHMDGATALKYARTRHGSSDIYRMRRQQEIIMAIRDRVLSTDALPNLIANAPDIMGTLTGAVSTDLSLPEMIQLVNIAKDLPAGNINRVVMDETCVQDYTTPAGAQVLLPITDRIPSLIERLYGIAAGE
ncbi:MAG: LCP family protein [Chloroflexi bacterium]|nr:LCP family protein [Chloroflexota bacterium]MCL5274466.1 LCP family protein [Chloroflexota bacterium]